MTDKDRGCDMRVEEIVLAIGFCLWREHPGRGKRRFSAERASFNQTNITHAAQRECTRDR